MNKASKSFNKEGERQSFHRKLAIGAEITDSGVNFRVYASLSHTVDVVLENPPHSPQFFALQAEGDGYFSGTFSEFKEGSLYRFRLDNCSELYPDPASRYQPNGPFGPSQVINPAAYLWKDSQWKGINIENQVIYEIHLGTFTPDGTLRAAQHKLAELAELGITVIELMPLNDFAGQFGWGYDGVNLFAPTRLYGAPDDLRSFIDAAHHLNLAVIIDVVYNHLGPAGNFLEKFSENYLKNVNNDWGKAINFDIPSTRTFFLENIRYWLTEFHFDGLRFDATQNITCTTPVHILAEMSQAAREAASGRGIVVIGENELQESVLLKSYQSKGYGFDAQWNDDFHHSAMVRLTGKREGYYKDYLGNPQEFISSLKYGFLFQGQYNISLKKDRGSSFLDIRPTSFILYIQNHDQIANSGRGLRIHQLTDPGNLKAMTALFLLAPGIPMLFQGQEFASSSPFFYFADHSAELNQLIGEGRKKFLSQFPNLATPEMDAIFPQPSEQSTFLQCKINFEERKKNASIYLLHKDLIRIRKNDPVISQKHIHFDGAVLNANSFLIRFFDPKGNDRLLIVNFGADLEIMPAPEPLLAPTEGSTWEILWSSEDPKYGGHGTAMLDHCFLKITGHSAMLLASVKQLKAHPHLLDKKEASPEK